jgi:hypothetical protein
MRDFEREEPRKSGNEKKIFDLWRHLIQEVAGEENLTE